MPYKKPHPSSYLLRAASSGNCLNILKWHRQGGDPNHRNKAGATPMMLAASGRHHEAVCLLLSLGAEVSARDFKGLSIDDYANGRDRDATADVLSTREIASMLAAAILGQGNSDTSKSKIKI